MNTSGDNISSNEMGISSGTIGSNGDGKITRASTNIVEVEVVPERKRIKKFKTKVKRKKTDDKKETRSQRVNKGRQVLFVDEVVVDRPVPLVEVVEVESYKQYNEPFPENYSNGMDDDGKAYCNCSCLIY